MPKIHGIGRANPSQKIASIGNRTRLNTAPAVDPFHTSQAAKEVHRPSLTQSDVGKIGHRTSGGHSAEASSLPVAAASRSDASGIERPLVLAPLRLRDDLEEHHHDDTGPQCPTERI